MTDGRAGLASAEHRACEKILPLRAHWHYNIDTVSVATTQLAQPK